MLINVQLGEEQETQTQQEKSAYEAVGSVMRTQFEEWKAARQSQEDEWIRDLRAYMGVYDPEVELAPKRSKVYVRLTATKVMAAYAKLCDLLFQSSDNSWSLDPAECDEDSVGIERMTDLMEDQLSEAGFEGTFKNAILEMCILGSGAIAGVDTTVRDVERWVQTPYGWMSEEFEDVSPEIRAVSVFSLYPDPHATSMSDAMGIYERHILNRKQFESLASAEGFIEPEIRAILIENPTGNYSELPYEIAAKSVHGKTATASTTNNRYEVLRYWGHVSGQNLEACGIPDVDPASTYHANMWLCGTRVIRVMLNPSKPQRIPYHIIPYERVPLNLWGVGPGRMMRDSQITINAATRSMLDNLAISSGPQLEVDMRSLAPGEDPHDIRPMRVWLRDGGDPSSPLLRMYQIANNVNESMAVIDIFRRHADEETMLPSFTHGEQAPFLNKTATGMSILQTSANVMIKSVVRNIDVFGIEPLITSLYNWNMQWHPDQGIKCAAKVRAKGSTSLMAKEIKSQRINAFLAMTANPLDAQLIDRAYLLREAATSMDIDPERAIPDANTSMLPDEAGIGANPGLIPEHGMDGADEPFGPDAGVGEEQLGGYGGRQEYNAMPGQN